MKKQQILDKEFTREKLANTIASYQLYYQITLGDLIQSTSIDKEKLDEEGLDINPENVLNTMIEIINSFAKEDNFDSIFEDNMRVNAMIHALKDFTTKFEDLNKESNIYDTFYEKIMEDKFFTISMQVLFSEELKSRTDFWKNLINKETAKELKASALKLI